jgi:hypothetical protein
MIAAAAADKRSLQAAFQKKTGPCPDPVPVRPDAVWRWSDLFFEHRAPARLADLVDVGLHLF